MDTTRLICHYFILIPLLLYCLDPKLALTAFSYVAASWLPWFDILIITCHYTCLIQNNLTDLHNHVNNKISHVCKSKVMSSGNVTSCENATLHGNSMFFSSENSMICSWKFLFPQQNLAFYMQNISCFHTCPHV